MFGRLAIFSKDFVYSKMLVRSTSTIGSSTENLLVNRELGIRHLECLQLEHFKRIAEANRV